MLYIIPYNVLYILYIIDHRSYSIFIVSILYSIHPTYSISYISYCIGSVSLRNPNTNLHISERS